MKLLFDTHAFIWWDGEQSKLSAAALATCQSPANSLHLSLASVWELQIKMQLGKLALRVSLADLLRDQQQQNGLVLEQVTLEDILALSALPTLHRDPFDRLIIAQANRGGFHLLTHDKMAFVPVTPVPEVGRFKRDVGLKGNMRNVRP